MAGQAVHPDIGDGAAESTRVPERPSAHYPGVADVIELDRLFINKGRPWN